MKISALFASALLLVVPSLSASCQAQTPMRHHAHVSQDTSVIVWVNLKTGIYHYKGERWYGRTKYGQFMSEKAAIAAGYRATENGQ